MKMYNPTTKLPDDLLFCIGKIMVDYAYFEHCLSSLIYVLMDVNSKVGRITVRSPTAVDSLKIINDLLKLRGQKIEGYSSIQKRTENIQARRNQLAHGVWVINDGKIKLRILNDSFEPIKGKGKVKRKITPQIIPYTAKDCIELIKEINKLSVSFEKYLGKIIPKTLPHPISA
jgi:hypothetical protein